MVGLINGGGYPRGWKLVDEEVFGSSGRAPAIDVESVRRLHRHEPRENQCTSVLVKHIQAPIHLVSVNPLLLSTIFRFSVHLSLSSFPFWINRKGDWLINLV